jgi:hypothetical protein
VNAGEPTLNSDITLDSDVHIGVDQYSFTVTTPTTVTVNNYGNLNISPITIITGSFTTLTLTANGKTFSYSEALSSQTLTIDHDKMTALIGSTNKLGKITGDFIELVPGDNSVQIGGTGLNCSIEFQFKPRFI